MLHDTYHRPLKDVRISVTDRCNFRCTYCMPLEEYEWLEKSEILSEVISAIWLKRTDRYSEERLAALHSPTGYDPKSHQKIEMIS